MPKPRHPAPRGVPNRYLDEKATIDQESLEDGVLEYGRTVPTKAAAAA